MRTSEYIARLEDLGDINFLGFKDLKLYCKKVTKEAILIDTNYDIDFWVDYWYDDYGDLNWDYNMYIFHLENSNDLKVAIIQDLYFQEIDDLVYENALENENEV